MDEFLPQSAAQAMIDREYSAKQCRAVTVMLRIVGPSFVAGIVRGGPAAPCIRYMKGWTLKQIRAYCSRRGWTVETLSDV